MALRLIICKTNLICVHLCIILMKFELKSEKVEKISYKRSLKTFTAYKAHQFSLGKHISMYIKTYNHIYIHIY